MIRIFAGLFFIFLLLSTHFAMAQGSSNLKPIPNVYLDCSGCDVTYIRSNVTFVNYVRDQDDASIYLTINSQRTAGGGVEYSLVFNSLDEARPRRDTLRYSSPSTDSSDERRIGLNRVIKIGLVPFLTQTVAMRNMDIFYEEPLASTDGETEEIVDPWDNWVFDVSLRSNMGGQSSEFNFGLYSSLEAERTTPIWKYRGHARGEIRRREVELSERTLSINRDWGDSWHMMAYSLSEHATVGLFARAQFNKTNNIALNSYIAPAFEYNFFPYSQYQERRFIVQYQLTPMYRKYYDTTIFLQDSELIMSQEVSTRLRYDRPWGRIDIRASGVHYFHDTSINRVEINPSFDIRVVRGLSVSLSGRYRLINDQLSLALPSNVDPNDPESIIAGVQRPTAYDYSISFGLSYTFGSIYNNVVNPRL